MQRMNRRTLIGVAMLTLAAGPLMAESQSGQNETVKWAYQSSNIIGHTLISDNGNELGTIDELVFDESGRITHFVLSRGGFMGINATKTLMPWSALGEVDDVTGTYIATINSATIENAPQLSPNDLEALANPDLTREVDKYFSSAELRDTGMASSKPDSDKIRQKFSKYDKDSDGMLSREEAKAEAGLASSFEEVDSDADGSISRAEYSRFAVTQ